jgi:hypothetical protein
MIFLPTAAARLKVRCAPFRHISSAKAAALAPFEGAASNRTSAFALHRTRSHMLTRQSVMFITLISALGHIGGCGRISRWALALPGARQTIPANAAPSEARPGPELARR